MSYSTFFGAIAVPREIADVYHYTDTTAPQMFGSSRSGWFHGVCEQLLDALPGHDALQFLAGKIWTREVQEDSGRTVWTVLGEGAVIGVPSAIDALLGACKQQPRVFIDRVFDSYGNLSKAEVLLRFGMRARLATSIRVLPTLRTEIRWNSFSQLWLP